jgi:rhodanese-related sulfurtransferase
MPGQSESAPRRIQPEEAHAASQAGRAVLVDVRDAPLYQNAHLDPSISLPLAELEAAGRTVPPSLTNPEDALIILYCA